MDVPPPHDQNARSYQPPRRRRRRFTIWTLLAPAAAILLWVSFFSALGKSCVFKECVEPKDNGTATAAEANGDERNDLDQGARYKVKLNDSLGAIAARYELTEEELKACNPLVDPQAMQPGDRLLVSAIDCEESDKAEAGANPDPLAGDTTAGANGTEVPDPTDNGTAAADPSAQADGKTSKDAEG